MPDEMATNHARITSSELSLLIQMIDGFSRESRAGFERLDHKLDGMLPRTEFEANSRAVDQRFIALGADIDRRFTEVNSALTAAKNEHDAIYKEIEVVDKDVRVLDDKVDSAANERAKEFKTMNVKLWGALGGAVLTVATGLAVAFLTHL